VKISGSRNKGDFCKNGNTQTAEETALYMTMGEVAWTRANQGLLERVDFVSGRFVSICYQLLL